MVSEVAQSCPNSPCGHWAPSIHGIFQQVLGSCLPYQNLTRDQWVSPHCRQAFAFWATRVFLRLPEISQQLICWHVSPLWSLGQNNTNSIFIQCILKVDNLFSWIQTIFETFSILSLKRWAILWFPLICFPLFFSNYWLWIKCLCLAKQMLRANRTSCPMLSIWFLSKRSISSEAENRLFQILTLRRTV